MRQHKYRIWDNLKKEWLNKKVYHSSITLDANGIGEFSFKQHPEGYTVQQYAGKNDELGQEVYEGDIVYLNHYGVPTVDMSCLFEVIFDDGAFQLKPIKLGTPPNGGISDFTWMRYIEGEDSEGNTIYRYELPPPKLICVMNRMRVIGNIFETPELLK